MIKAIRRECLDWLIILGERHLTLMSWQYPDHYNRRWPHLAPPCSRPPRSRHTEPAPSSAVEPEGRLIDEYARAA
ncbi:MAG: hypothetical protein ACYDA0_13845 [Candidatus Dormibacteraceae bacterium]